MLEALVHAVGDGTIVEQGGEHLVHRAHDRIGAADVEQRLLLPGEGGFRQILRGGGGAHGNRCIDAAFRHCRVARDDLLLQTRGERGREDPLADPGAGHRELHDVVDVETGELGLDSGGEALVRDKVAVCIRRRRKAARNRHAESREPGDHFAQRGILAADLGDVVPTQLCKGKGVRTQAWSSC